VFAIGFGLWMDYEIFLVSRIHEQWQHHHNQAPPSTNGSLAPAV
jgi:putative drug exporter of the RND superfamily